MSMYIRVKRQKTTVFLQVEPTDTVLEVKQKLQALWTSMHCALCCLQAPDKLRLLKEKLADLKVENDDVVALVYLKEDGSGFEGVKILAPGAEDDAGGSSDGAVKQEPKQEAQ
ncbi:ubiquitin-like protein-like protein [Scenedesmus sp. NREL 46B-D3]|nr:ubiquitin-like protein-like protein [Scenedesmus sp. NREL 46B-D3]